MGTGFRKTTDLPQVIPVFPLDGALLLPHGTLPLNIFEPRYLNMIDDALAHIGCVGKITSFAETPDGRYLISLTGLCRFAVGQELLVQTPYRQIRADYAAFGADLKPVSEDDGFDRIHFLQALKS